MNLFNKYKVFLLAQHRDTLGNIGRSAVAMPGSFFLAHSSSSRVDERLDLVGLQHIVEGVDPADDLLPETFFHRLRGPEILHQYCITSKRQMGSGISLCNNIYLRLKISDTFQLSVTGFFNQNSLCCTLMLLKLAFKAKCSRTRN